MLLIEALTMTRSFGVRITGLAIVAVAVALTPVPVQAAAEPAPQVSPAIDGVLELFKQKSVVALGDAHGLAQEAAFYGALMRDPRFAEQVGNVVVEFGGAIAQDIVDRYVAGESVPFTELRRIWTDVVGWFPGETSILGVANFFASVRAANLKLPPEHRIKVWLGDPKIDWSQVRSFQDVRPLLGKRDDNLFGIVDEQILKKHKKALLIVGLGHLFGPGGTGPLSAKINQVNPNALAIVAPFLGYIEAECNAKFVARAKTWPTPALAAPVGGTWLKSQLQLSGCNFVPPPQAERMKKMAANGPPPGGGFSGPSGPGGPGGPNGPGVRLGGGPGGPGKAPSPLDMLAAEIDVLSGMKADAILYLGPPETLTQSPVEPSLYLDPDYFKELDRRSRCCTPAGRPLDWGQLLQQSSAVGSKFQAH